MTPLTLTINNFLSFKQAKIALDKTGLVAVQGVNLDGNGADSNGSGKSSLFIAIRWCLYGETDKDMPSDDVVNDTAGKNCLVETHWLDEATNIEYKITRYRKHTKHKNKLRFEVKHPGLDWEDKTLGKNDLTQKSVNHAMGMDDAVFMAACFASQESPVDIPAMGDSELKALLEKALPFAKIDPLYKKYKAVLDGLTKEHSQLVSKLASDEHSLAGNTNLLMKTLAEEKAHLATQGHYRAEIVATLTKLKATLADLNKRVVDLPALNALQASLEAKSRELGSGNASLQMVRLEAAEKRLEALKKQGVTGGDCPTCMQPFPKEKLAEHKAKHDLDMAIEHIAIINLKDEIDTIWANAPIVDKLWEKTKDIMAQISDGADVNREIANTKRLMQNEAINYKRLEGNPFASSVEMLQENIKKDNDRINEIKARLPLLNADIAVYTNLAESLSPKGFRYHMLESVTNELNKQTNYYLSMLTDGKIGAVWSTVKRLSSGEFREAFSIRVNMNGRSNFGALSGGQKRKVRLACWFALQDMIADRAEKDVKLWVCDEVDGALDKAGIERLMSLLEEKARTKETVLVISHNNLKDWIANGITVSMKDDISEVSGFLNVV